MAAIAPPPAGAGGASVAILARVLGSLKDLDATLSAAKSEETKLREENAALAAKNAKLEYQVTQTV